MSLILDLPNTDPTIEDPGYSGGGGGANAGSPAVAPEGFEEVMLDEGGTLALAYGIHLVAGHLTYYKRVEGPPPSVTAFYAQGEGPWNQPVKVWYAGEEIASSPDGSTPGYHFHPGTQSSGPSDPEQGIDSFVPGGITYNRTAYTAVLLPEKFSSEERPDKLRGRYECLLVADYDDTGAETDAGSYSANPARVAADLLIKRGKLPTTRIDWPSWVAWRDYCDEVITWNDGETTHDIARFEAHSVFLQPVDLPEALDSVCVISCTRWQDDGEKIQFLLPTDATIQHTFRPSNVVQGSVKAYPIDVQAAPRHILVKFRDPLDEFVSETSVESKRDLLIDAFGDLISTRYFPNMNHSQAQRIVEYMFRLETDFARRVELTAAADSLHLLPGDFVALDLGDSNLDGNYLILEASDNSAERTPDEREFKLQRIEGALYSDSDHRPIQRPVSV
jgi:hypothetical protein